MNPYLSNNPYMPYQEPEKPKTNYGGYTLQVAPLALQIVQMRNKGMLKMPDFPNSGKGLDIPKPTVNAEGLDAFNLPTTETTTEPSLDAFNLNSPAEAGAELATPTEAALDPSLFEGLDAFDFDKATLMAPIEDVGVSAGMGGAGEAAGTLTAAEAAELEGLGASTASIGAETGGATLGSVAGGAASALPWYAALKIGGPYLKQIMQKGTEDLTGSDPESSNVLQQMNRAALNTRGAVAPLYEEFTGKEMNPWIEGLTNPAGYIFGRVLGCIIISACTSRDSYEVNIARRFRDKYMDEETLTGYYALCVLLVPFIKKYPLFKRIVKRALVDRLVDYGEWKLEIKPDMKYATSGVVKRLFLGLCRHVGKGVDSILAMQEV